MPHIERKHKIGFAGLLISLGVIYGDIGTSPLYVIKAIIGVSQVDKQMVLGAVSCVFWVLTIQTTIKYVVFTLNADNKGEGGVFSLYFLLRKKSKFFVIPAIIGACALLADGIIAPPISITSAIEGLNIIYPETPVVLVVIIILSFLFFIQQFGTNFIGNAFGPVMFLWFTIIGILGLIQIVQHPFIITAINPIYGIKLLINHPEGILLLGAVFLCTTGAESLYSDLGHCGKRNIRNSWIFVKTCLVINYFGQAAWVLHAKNGAKLDGINPFYAIVPQDYLLIMVFIATAATIIASQAIITGSYTLISEAVKLNLWPKIKINYPSMNKGQMYVPGANNLLWVGCIIVVLIFEQSHRMEAAYGLTITLAMLMTTLLMVRYLISRRYPAYLVNSFMILFLIMEILFLIGTGSKFYNGGWFAVLVGLILFIVMWSCFVVGKMKKRYIKFVQIKKYIPMIKDMSNDKDIPPFCSNLVYLTNSSFSFEAEYRIFYSILQNDPKKADIYWLVHVNVTDEPHTQEYMVKQLIANKLFRVDFNLGFKVEQHLNIFLRKVVEELTLSKEVDIIYRFASLKKYNIKGNFRFIILEKIFSDKTSLSLYERLIVFIYSLINRFSLPTEKSFGLDLSDVIIEKVPLIFPDTKSISLQRIKEDNY